MPQNYKIIHTCLFVEHRSTVYAFYVSLVTRLHKHTFEQHVELNKIESIKISKNQLKLLNIQRHSKSNPTVPILLFSAVFPNTTNTSVYKKITLECYTHSFLNDLLSLLIVFPEVSRSL